MKTSFSIYLLAAAVLCLVSASAKVMRIQHDFLPKHQIKQLKRLFDPNVSNKDCARSGVHTDIDASLHATIRSALMGTDYCEKYVPSAQTAVTTIRETTAKHQDKYVSTVSNIDNANH